MANTEIMLHQTSKLAEKFGIACDPQELILTMKHTVFKTKDGEISNENFNTLLIVANEYGLNPFTKEIYAFPDKNNGIVPVVGIDGWTRIINSHPQFNGMEYRYSENMETPQGAKSSAHEWVECVIYRKDREHPIVVREYLDEVYRPPFSSPKGYVVDGAWQTHPKRMLRHKAIIQAARLAFGFSGIYDQDEAERINEAQAEKSKETSKNSNSIKGKPEDPEYETLLEAANRAANCGEDVYSHFWQKRLTSRERKIIGSEQHERLKAIAQNTIVQQAEAQENDHATA